MQVEGFAAKRLDKHPAQSAAAIGHRFGGRFGKVVEEPIGTADVKQNPVVEEVKKIWAKLEWMDRKLESRAAWSIVTEDYFPERDIFTGILSGLEKHYTADEVREMSIALGAFQNEQFFTTKVGYLISALVAHSKDSDFEIPTGQFKEPVSHLGMFNTKNVKITGNAQLVGEFMTKGMITVKGNIFCLSMPRGGTIVVNGNVGYIETCSDYTDRVRSPWKCDVGTPNFYAVVRINGSLGYDVDMQKLQLNGREVHLDGELIEHLTITGGKFYHNGKLISE